MSSQSSLRCNVLLPQHSWSWLLILSRLSYTFLLSYTRQARVVRRIHSYVVVHLHQGYGVLTTIPAGGQGPFRLSAQFRGAALPGFFILLSLDLPTGHFAAALPVIFDLRPTAQRLAPSFVRGVHFFGVLCALFHWSLQGFSNKRALPRSCSSLFVAGIAVFFPSDAAVSRSVSQSVCTY